ncbi:MAG TPA: AAA family ATPase [Kofleriaceae bacterium]|nr:AAA family ATPase [Kofleriaceae bacterium]
MGSIEEQSEAHRRFGPVYFTSLRVAGVRCFGPAQTLNLAHGNRPAKWTVILGENGVGKTTLLQCAWAISPSISEPRPGALGDSHPRGAHAPGLVLRRSAASTMSITSDLALGELLASGRAGSLTRASLVSSDPRSTIFRPYPSSANAICCGYGALRRSNEGSVEAGASIDSAASLLSDDAELISGSEWLLRADYAANTTADGRAVARRDKIQAALVDLLPDVSNIRVAGLDEQPPRPRLDVQTPYGWLAMRSLSLGYRSMIAWVVDLASRMFEAYPDSADPLSEPAIALVDEIDLHLHPRWQREITAHLDRLFPNVQFIVTAHSPLVVQAPGVTNVAVLRRVDDHVEIVNDPEEVRGWRVDQILTSDLFGLSSARPVEVEKLLERQQELVLLDAPTEAQRAEFAAVDAKLAELVPGETAQDRETWAVVRRLANRLASDPGHG